MKFTRLITLCAALCVGMGAQAVGPKFLGIANHVGVDLGGGTTGISVEAATPITPFVQARVGVDIMPGITFKVNSDVNFDTPAGPQHSEIDLKGSLSRVQGHLLFNIYPLGNRFPLFVAAGGYFAGKDMVKITGHAPGIAELGGTNGTVNVGDYELPLDEHGNAKGALRTSSFRPYVGIGTGRPCPVGRLNFVWELGVQFQKKPYVWDDYNNKKIDFAEFSSDDTFQKVMDHFSVYPVLKFTISGRIF